jgi:UDP-N-acetylmuramyl pentapeptide phosphotransferase/UDP-N-acetylglucosamine-1-phosphate transferase
VPPGTWQAALAVWVVALVATWLSRRYALSRALIDAPGERRSHRVATPRGGGIGIVVAWLAAAMGPAPGGWGWSMAGFVLVAAIGYADDHRHVDARLRLAVHAVAGLLLGIGLAHAGASTALVVTGVLLVPVLVNVWNFIDGIDGLAASQAALAALAFAWLGDGAASWPAVALAAACVGFLPFNLPRARIFLGDVGSGALGYALASLACHVALDGGRSAIDIAPLLFLPLSACVIDASLTLLNRIMRGERWWTPHVQHAYQQLAARWGRHVPVTFLYGGWTVCAMLLAGWLQSQPAGMERAVVAATCVAGAVAWGVARGRRRD